VRRLLPQRFVRFVDELARGIEHLRRRRSLFRAAVVDELSQLLL